MANDFIDGCAVRFGELPVVERRRIRIANDVLVVNDLVKLIGRDSRLYVCRCCVEDLSCHLQWSENNVNVNVKMTHENL